MEQPERELPPDYAGFWVRLGAHIIDSIVLLVLGVAAMLAVGYIVVLCSAVFGGGGIDIIDAMAYLFDPALLVTIWLLVVGSYFVCFWVWRGQTPGRMLLRVKLVGSDSSSLTWKAALLRYLGYLINWAALCLPFLWIAFDRRKQGLHDKIAGTYAIMLDTAVSAENRHE